MPNYNIQLKGIFGEEEGRIMEILCEAASKCSVLCEKIASDKCNKPILKDDESPVTVADFACQLIISRAILSIDPNAYIIAEEDLSHLSPQVISHYLDLADYSSVINHSNVVDENGFWTIDPIDGTKGYLRGDQYAICISYIHSNKVQRSILCCPRLSNIDQTTEGVMFIAIRGKGSYEVDLFTGNIVKLPLTTSTSNLTDAIIIEGYESSHADHSFSQRLRENLAITGKIIRMDSQCKYGMVARGLASVYLRKPARPEYQEKIWDHAPGSLIVEEAGGVFSDLSGRKDVFRPNALLHSTGGLIATNLSPSHYNQILNTINEMLNT